jgi:hypothetical protein
MKGKENRSSAYMIKMTQPNDTAKNIQLKLGEALSQTAYS